MNWILINYFHRDHFLYISAVYYVSTFLLALHFRWTRLTPLKWWMTRSDTLFPICVQSTTWLTNEIINTNNLNPVSPVKRNRLTCACCKFYFCSLSPFAWNLMASHLMIARTMTNVPKMQLVMTKWLLVDSVNAMRSSFRTIPR